MWEPSRDSQGFKLMLNLCYLSQLAIGGGGGLPEESVANLVLGTETGTLVQRFGHQRVADGTCQHLLIRPPSLPVHSVEETFLVAMK